MTDLDALDRMVAEAEAAPILWTSRAAFLWNVYPAIAAELREARKRVRELEAEVQVRDDSANETLRILREALPNRGFHSEMEAAEAAKEEIRRLEQANGDLRKERDRAVAEAQRQDAVAKGLRKERDAANERNNTVVEVLGSRFALPFYGQTLGDAVRRELSELEAKLAAASEREAGLLALVERMREAAELAECYAKVLRCELESRNPETFPGSEDQGEVDGDLTKIAAALSLTPLAALDELRRREREAALRDAAERIGPEYGEHQAAWALRKMADDVDSGNAPSAISTPNRRERLIGAEIELRRIAAEDCDTVFPGDLPHITSYQLLDRADAIAAERVGEGGAA